MRLRQVGGKAEILFVHSLAVRIKFQGFGDLRIPVRFLGELPFVAQLPINSSLRKAPQKS
jgi:hypothetical protein